MSEIIRKSAPHRIDVCQCRSNNGGMMTPEQLAAFAELVCKERRMFGSRAAFATAIGITRSTLRAWERGQQHPTDVALERLSRVIDRSVLELKGEAPLMPDDPRLRDLVDVDLETAQQFHHAPPATKHAMKKLISAPVPDGIRERIACVVDLLLRHQDALLESVEDIANNYDAPHRAVTKPVLLQPVAKHSPAARKKTS